MEREFSISFFLSLLMGISQMKNKKQLQEPTWNYPLRIVHIKGVFHKHPRGCGLIPSQFVPHNQSVVAVVHVGGLVQEETAVLH